MPPALPIVQFRARAGLLDLGWGHPHPDALPMRAWTEAYAAAIRRHGAAALTYGNSAGPGPLIEWLRGRYGDRPAPAPEEIMVTAGASHALELVCATLVRPTDAVLVAAPTYHLALRTIADHTTHVLAAPADAGGIDPEATARRIDELRAAGTPVALLYTVPTFNNPTGASLDPGRRARLAALAAETGVALVEDETYRELAYDRPPAPSPHGDGATAIRIGSFAKSVAPGLRLGWLVAAAPLVRRIRERGYVDSGGGLNHATALAMAEFGHSGAYDEHLQAVRTRYRAHRDALDTALRRDLPGAEYERPAGGWFIWLRLPGLSAAALLPAAEAAGVSYLDGGRFSPQSGTDPDRLRISFAMLGPDDLTAAIGRLASAVDRFGAPG